MGLLDSAKRKVDADAQLPGWTGVDRVLPEPSKNTVAADVGRTILIAAGQALDIKTTLDKVNDPSGRFREANGMLPDPKTHEALFIGAKVIIATGIAGISHALAAHQHKTMAWFTAGVAGALGAGAALHNTRMR